ncbi:hypothetical protein GCM10029964_043710 [Kibdelosporangium lantanae]
MAGGQGYVRRGEMHTARGDWFSYDYSWHDHREPKDPPWLLRASTTELVNRRTVVTPVDTHLYDNFSN